MKVMFCGSAHPPDVLVYGITREKTWRCAKVIRQVSFVVTEEE